MLVSCCVDVWFLSHTSYTSFDAVMMLGLAALALFVFAAVMVFLDQTSSYSGRLYGRLRERATKRDSAIDLPIKFAISWLP